MILLLIIVLVLWGFVPDKITYGFIINFQETDTHSILSVSVLFLYIEQFFHSLKHNAWFFSVAEHCVSLACSSGSICKNSTVEAIQHSET